MWVKLSRGLECLIIFGLLPFGLYYMMLTPPSAYPVDLGGFEPRRLIFPLLWIAAAAVMLHWKRHNKGKRLFPKPPWKDMRRRMLPRFALAVAVLSVMTHLLDPTRLLSLPLNRPEIWVVVMVLYPLVSVVPQEVLFRLFFFERYRLLFGEGRGMILVSGLAFGHAHLLFNNWIAYLLSMIGGVLFSMTYARTKNLSEVWIEHALYGQFIFTIGLGWYFYTGAVSPHG